MALSYGNRAAPTAEEAETTSRLGLSIEALRGMRAAITETAAQLADFFGISTSTASVAMVSGASIVSTGPGLTVTFLLNPPRAAKWDFGDGSAKVSAPASGTSHTYVAGTFTVVADFGSGIIPTKTITTPLAAEDEEKAAAK